MCKPQGDFQNFLLRPVQGNAVSFCGHDTANYHFIDILSLRDHKIKQKKRVNRIGNKN